MTRVLLALASVPVLAAIAFHLAVACLPYPHHLANPAPAATIACDRAGVPLAAFAAPDGQWRFPLRDDEISPHLVEAIVAVEDGRFFEHAGVDWTAAGAAAWQNVSGLRVRRGASTLTMQLHRLRDPRPRSLWAKLEQTVRAAQIERQLGKREILTEYLNRAPFGGNLVGVGAASWRYFGKPCASLSLGEAALLAGLPKNPNRYRPNRFPDRAAARRDAVLDRMRHRGVITDAQQAHARAEPIRAEWRDLPQADDIGALPTLARLSRESRDGHGRIATTIDADLQREAFAAARTHLDRLAASGVSSAAVVVLDTQSAECLAVVSVTSPGADRRASSIDLTRRPRSTGSVLKPLIYAAAFEAGVCGPDSVLDDAPAAWAGYVPRDFDRQFRGEMTAAAALADSRNIPAMAVLARAGVGHVRGVMEASGLRTLERADRTFGLSLAIGGAEATPMEVAAAYAGLARGGISLSPVLRGEGRGEGLNERSDALWATDVFPAPSPLPSPPSTGERERRFLTDRACMQTLAALSDSLRTTAISSDAARLNVAWKTGTSSGHRDAWCAAVTPRRTVVVWLGNAGGEPSTALVGRDAAAPLALELIASLDDTPAEWPVDSATVDGKAVVARHRERPRFAIVSPAPAKTIFMNGDAPAESQRIPLRASGMQGEQVHWFVDGNHVGAATAGDQTIWWTPTPGAHDVRAVTSSGSAAVTIAVRAN